MIIQITKNRRLLRYTYGWQIQRRKTVKPKNGGKPFDTWKEENPAYPANLIQALEMCLERELAEKNPEIDLEELPAAIERATKAVLKSQATLRSNL